MKVLIVDDSGVQRKLISQILKKAGFDNEILEASDGREAIQQLGAHYQDVKLILCDWNMPNLSGIEFLEAVAKVPQVSMIPCIMVTTEGTEQKIQEAHQRHPFLRGYLVKPFTPEQLKEKVEKFLRV
jgi:two-component system, chemotaxis family, chemotaxis protein CheY